jgi:hypothetical protein
VTQVTGEGGTKRGPWAFSQQMVDAEVRPMAATVYDLARARLARLNGEHSLLHLWTPRSGPIEVEDLRIGDRVRFRDGKIGTILCFGAGSVHGPLLALVAVNGMHYTYPVSELKSAS